MKFKANPLVPELSVTDVKRSLHFYCHILGFQIEFERPENGFAFLSFGGSQLMLDEDGLPDSPWLVGPMEYPRGQGLNLSIECPSAKELADKLAVTQGHDDLLRSRGRWRTFRHLTRQGRFRLTRAKIR
jgi:catechol 2,3-dioxygenase-like lactoylglutathione lyase family enzyme